MKNDMRFVTLVVEVQSTDGGQLPGLQEVQETVRDTLCDALDGEHMGWRVVDAKLKNRP